MIKGGWEMLEYEWFVSILDKEDLVGICKHYRIHPDGFAKKLENAPLNRLANELKSYLIAALTKRKRKTLKYDDLLSWVVEDIQKRKPYINEFSFESFCIQMETDTSLKKYQIVALLHQIYPEKYKEKLNQIMENTERGAYILNGLSQWTDQPTLEKIKVVLESSIKQNDVKERLEGYEKECIANYPDIYPQAKEWIQGDEGRLLEMLVRTDEKEQPYVLLAFLLSKGNFQKQAYQDLIWQVESSFEYNRYTIEKGKRDTLMRDFSSLAEERKRLECEVHGLQSIRESYKILQEELEELKKQKMDITRRLHQSERIFPYFEQLVEKRPFFIITSDVEIFEGTPFENNVVDKKNFLDDRKKKDIEVYLDKVLFFTRSSFHSREWGRLKNFLDNNTLKYVEIGHFDLASYLEDIMRNIYLEENEYGYHI